MKRIIVSSGARWEDQVGYSRLVRVGDELFVTGTVAMSPEGELVGEGDAYLQARQCLLNIERALNQVGASLADVVRTRIFVTDIRGDWESVGRAHAELLGSVRPATSMVEVSRLIAPGFLVEIEADGRLGWREVAAPGDAGDSADGRALRGASREGSPHSGGDPLARARIEEAAFNETAGIRALLEAAGLPVPGAKDRPVRFLVARRGGELAACVGWELAGDAALLRSCAVATALRGRGLGAELVRKLGRRLEAEGVRRLYLLTIDAAAFFARFGFAPAERESVPEGLAASREFAIHACDAALCMAADLPLD